jgi:hypothetical protein
LASFWTYSPSGQPPQWRRARNDNTALDDRKFFARSPLRRHRFYRASRDDRQQKALGTPTAKSLRRLRRKLDRRCARAAEALAAMRDEGAALIRRGPDFSVGHLRLDATAAAIVLACANVVAVNDLFGNAQTWRWADE